MRSSLHLLVCQYYLREAQAIVHGPEFEGVTVSAYPDVCVHPQAERMKMVERLFGESESSERTVVLVGGCFMPRTGQRPLVEDRLHKVYHADLCFSLLLNKTLIDDYLRAGAYLVTPGWLEVWEQHLADWKFDQPTAQAFFSETTRKLVLLDTGVDPEAAMHLKTCSEYLKLPSERVPTGLDMLRLVLAGIVQDWRRNVAHDEAATAVGKAHRKLADYMLALDLLVKLTRIMTEDEAIHLILELFVMLFGAGNVSYATVVDGTIGTIHATHPESDDARRMHSWIERLGAQEDTATTESGFCLRIKYQDETVGIVCAYAVAFPQHESDYLNLALGIVNLCGLAIANARTITRREEAEDALRLKSEALARSNAELEQFAYVVSHDLQAPLRRVLAFGTLLDKEAGPALGDEARDYLARIQKSSLRMQRLIEGLLTYARVSTRGQPFTTVKLAAVIQQALEDLAPRLEESRGRVDVGDVPTVKADELQMYQLFQNLIGNALKFAARGRPPRVRVFSTLLGDGRVTISVEDNGIGFSPQDADRMFQPFQRLHTEEEYPGSGIGLAVCQKIVARHGGTITANGRPGEGSTFIVTLPACSDASP